MQIPPCASDIKPASVSLPDLLRNFHKELPLEGNPPNDLLTIPDDQLNYLIAVIRNTPRSAPSLSPDEWHSFLEFIQPHGIFPLLAFHLRTWPEESRPPQEIMEYLNRLFLLAAARSLRAGRQIQRITDALKEAGIPVILMKGHALARTVYPDPALRQSVDIDLLVQPENIPAAEEVLERMGYRCSAKLFYLSRHEYHHEIFSPPSKGLEIELHWRVDTAFNVFPEGWLNDAFLRRVPILSNDLSCDTFSHFDHLQVLAFHHVLQHWSLRLDRVYDITLMMANSEIENTWEELGRVSVEHHIRVPMELALTAARLWTGCGLPGGARDFSSWPAPAEREVHLLNNASKQHRDVLPSLYLVIQGQPGIFEKLRSLWRFIFPPLPLMAKFRTSSSPADIPLAYLRRWFRILKYV